MINKCFFRALAIIALGFAVYCARADVIACVESTCSTQAAKPKASLVDTDLVRFCTAGALTAGADAAKCTTSQWYSWGGMQSYSWTLTDAGWYRKSEIPEVAPFTPVKYVCKPKSIDEIRLAKEGSAGVALWYCDTPTKIQHHFYCGNPANIPVTMIKASLASLGLAMQSNQSRKCTAEEFALVQKLHAAEGIKITVTTNGTTTTRPIYSATAKNTRSAATGARANVGTGCGWKRLQNTDGTPTNYFEVTGGYTMCSVAGVVTK